MTDIAIFPARRRSDLPLVRAMADAIWRRHYPGIITARQIDYMLERGYSDDALARFTLDPGSGLALVHLDYEPVGFVAWYRHEAPATTKVDKLYVMQEVQARGLGRHLMTHVEGAARADGSTQLILNCNKHNASAMRFYERCGFTVRDSVVVDIGEGFVMDDYVLAKPL